MMEMLTALDSYSRNSIVIEALVQESAFIQLKKEIKYKSSSLLTEAEDTTKAKTGQVLQAKAKNKVGFFTKIVNAIKALWAKFKEAVLNMFATDKTWFEQYKTAIMNADLKDYERAILPYWKSAQLMSTSKVPQFNPNKIKTGEEYSSPDAYKAWLIKTEFGNYQKQMSTDNFVDSVNFVFRGATDEPEILKGSACAERLKSIFNYCETYDGIIKQIKADQDNIEKCGNYAKQQANSIANGTYKPSGTQPAKKENQDPNSNLKESLNWGMFLSEGIKGVDETKNKIKSQSETNQAVKAANEKIEAKNKEQTERQKATQSTINKEKDANGAIVNHNRDEINGKESMSEQDGSDLLDRINTYITVSNQLVGCKMTIYEEKYNAYKELLRNILKTVLGGEKGNNSSAISGNGPLYKKVQNIIKNAPDKSSDTYKQIDKLYKIWVELSNKINDKKTKEAEKKRAQTESSDVQETLSKLVKQYENQLA